MTGREILDHLLEQGRESLRQDGEPCDEASLRLGAICATAALFRLAELRGLSELTEMPSVREWRTAATDLGLDFACVRRAIEQEKDRQEGAGNGGGE